jgi:nicotinamidase-related amidase
VSMVLLVVDAQKIYTNPGMKLYCRDADSTIERINKLIANFQQQKLPVIFIRHVHKVDGSDLGRMFDFSGAASADFSFKENLKESEYADNLIRPADSIEICKNRYSAFVRTDLEKWLKKFNAQRVVICGFMTNYCCESAARDAHDRDYFVDFIVDATGNPGNEDMDEGEIRRIVGTFLAGGFACVLTAEEFLQKRTNM